MKKLQIIGIVILVLSIAGYLVWRFASPMPDWLVRVDGVLMLVSIFLVSFSTAKIAQVKK